MIGQEVGEIAHRSFSSGRHLLNWNLPNLPSGYYFFRFSMDKSVEMMPFLVINRK
jgi:hypothetical protein